VIHLSALRRTVLLVGALIILLTPQFAQAQQKTCDKAARPCLGQPKEGDIQTTGQWTADKAAPPANTAIAIILNKVTVGSAQLNAADGTFSFAGLPPLNRYDTVEAAQIPTGGALPTTGAVSVSGTGSPKVPEYKAPPAELLLGVDVTGAASTSPQAVFLGLATFDLRLGGDVGMFEKVNNPKSIWVSGKLGLAGMAQPGNVTGATSAGFYAAADNANPDKIVQSVDGALHLGWQMYSWPMSLKFFQPSADSDDSVCRMYPKDKYNCQGTASLSLILGGGAISPLSASQTTPQVYEATPLILQTQTPSAPFTTFAASCGSAPSPAPPGTSAPSTPAPSCYVVFIPGDRTRFYRSYDAGLRLKLYPLDAKDGDLRFPAMIDFTFGQNEYVTGGRMSGAVMHAGVIFPFPRIDGVYAFVNMDTALSKQIGGGPQLQLIPAPVTTGLTATSPSVYTISTTQPNRDRFALGFGVDIFHLFAKYFDAHPSSTSNASPK
jgi:hypothetical protein